MLRTEGSISPVASSSTPRNFDRSRAGHSTADLKEQSSPDGSGSHSGAPGFPDRFRLLNTLTASFEPGHKPLGEKDIKGSKPNKVYRVHIEPRMLQDSREPRKSTHQA